MDIEQFLDNFSDPIYISSLNGQILTVNQAACDFLGFTRTDLLQMAAMDIDIPEYACLVHQKIKTIAEKGRLIFETVHMRKDGSHQPVELNCRWIKYNGRPCILGVARDLSRCNRSEQELRNAKERLEAHMDNSPLAIIEFDPDYRVVRWSGAAERMFGWHSEEIVGKVITEMRWVHEDDMERVRQLSSMMLSGRHRRNVNINRNYRKDGSIIHCEWYNSAIYNDQGRLASVLSQVLDITERTSAEEALRKLNETLEEQVTERTRQSEERSRQLHALAVDLIEVEERERQRFAQMLHDDLQQLLAAARMQLQTIGCQHPAIPDLEGVEQLLQESLKKSRSLSHELSPPVLRQPDFAAALKWLARQMREKFELQVVLDADSSLDFEGPHLKVFVFRTVQELLFNIVKHAGVNKARVVLAVSVHHLDVTVSDTGRGFNPQIIDSAATPVGFGLLTIKERARHIGGRFVIESVPGQGSRFTLSVPFKCEQSGVPRRRATDFKPRRRWNESMR